MTSNTPADLAAQYDEQIARLQAEADERKRAEQQAKAEQRARLDAAIMAAVDAAGIDGQFLAIATSSNGEDRIGRIDIPGFARFVISAYFDGQGPRVWTEYNGVSFGRAQPDSISAVMTAARIKWLEMDRLNTLETMREHDAAGQRQKEQEAAAAEAQRRTAAQSAALAAWAPQYRQYCTDLAGAYAHNRAILEPIAADLSNRPFLAARLTYGYTADDADPALATIWIGDWIEGNRFTEIEDDGRLVDVTIWHPAKMTTGRTWTAAEAMAGKSYPSDNTTTPPIRCAIVRTGAGNWTIYGPAGYGRLDEEIDAMMAAAGQTLATAPELPEPPAVDNDRLIEAAAAIEAETMAPAERAALARYLVAGRMDAEIPF